MDFHIESDSVKFSQKLDRQHRDLCDIYHVGRVEGGTFYPGSAKSTLKFLVFASFYHKEYNLKPWNII